MTMNPEQREASDYVKIDHDLGVLGAAAQRELVESMRDLNRSQSKWWEAKASFRDTCRGAVALLALLAIGWSVYAWVVWK